MCQKKKKFHTDFPSEYPPSYLEFRILGNFYTSV